MKSAKLIVSTLALLLAANLMAQQAKISNWRPYGQEGINVFEAPKEADATFNRMKVRIGGSFTQQYQALEHSNNATYDTISYRGKPANANELYALAPGFNLASANLYIDAQLADGIRVALENYMSSRHHSEFWVKGGYIQIDKLPMFNNPEWFTKYLRVKIGHFQVNYGDQQFRRSDNGNTMYNPFVGNYIMDAFATEIGGEAYLFLPSGFMGMVGVTNGLIGGNIQDLTGDDPRAPSVYAKLAYDKQVSQDLRFRLSGSVYMNSGVSRNTLYAGDRAGSRFYMALEPAYYLPRGETAYIAADAAGLATSGRVSPGFSSEVTSFMINPFIKYKGLEVFGTFEQSKGMAYTDPKAEGAEKPDARTATQVAVEGIYRFLPNEQVFVGARYQQVSGELNARILENGAPKDLSVNRLEVSAGWFPIKNLLLKASYIDQKYNDFPSSNILSEGEFHGFMVEAALAF